MQYRNIVTKSRHAMLLIYFDDANEAIAFIDVLDRLKCVYMDADVKQKGYVRCIMIDIKQCCYMLYNVITELNNKTNISIMRENRFQTGGYQDEPPITPGIVSTKVFTSYKYFYTKKYFFDSKQDYNSLIKSYENIASMLEKNGVTFDGTKQVIKNIVATYDESGHWSPHPCAISFAANIARMFVEVIVLICVIEKQPFKPIVYLYDNNRK